VYQTNHQSPIPAAALDDELDDELDEDCHLLYKRLIGGSKREMPVQKVFQEDPFQKEAGPSESQNAPFDGHATPEASFLVFIS